MGMVGLYGRTGHWNCPLHWYMGERITEVQMSATPERVYIWSDGDNRLGLVETVSRLSGSENSQVEYVRADLLLAAEAERDMSRQLCSNAVGNYKALDADLATLREQVRVLTPLARMALAWIDGSEVMFRLLRETGHRKESDALKAELATVDTSIARAVLGKEGT